MLKARNVRFSKLDANSKNAILQKYRDSEPGQKVIKFPNTSDLWLLVPKGTPTTKTHKLLKFMHRLHKPSKMYLTEVPQSFLQATG